MMAKAEAPIAASTGSPRGFFVTKRCMPAAVRCPAILLACSPLPSPSPPRGCCVCPLPFTAAAPSPTKQDPSKGRCCGAHACSPTDISTAPPVPVPGALLGSRCQEPVPEEVFLPLGSLRSSAGETAALASMPAHCRTAPQCRINELRGTLSAIKNKRYKTVLLQAGVPPAASRSMLFNNVH